MHILQVELRLLDQNQYFLGYHQIIYLSWLPCLASVAEHTEITTLQLLIFQNSSGTDERL